MLDELSQVDEEILNLLWLKQLMLTAAQETLTQISNFANESLLLINMTLIINVEKGLILNNIVKSKTGWNGNGLRSVAHDYSWSWYLGEVSRLESNAKHLRWLQLVDRSARDRDFFPALKKRIRILILKIIEVYKSADIVSKLCYL